MHAPKKQKLLAAAHFHQCTPTLLIELVVELLDKLSSLNDNLPVKLTRFHSRSPPPISLKNYLDRISKYCIVYLDRMCAKNPTFAFNKLTSHRFIIISITVACKTLSDVYSTNPYFAKVGGITAQELNLLELEFCKAMDWDLSVGAMELQNYYLHILTSSGLAVESLEVD